ncbi:hypothetical protein V6N11_020132 [Hibiscus sabdariffa]|uniref:Uncharacterized protein n=1 Tax=Hibiscus sabdariffa TaxID=183260 RepID=A0ABR2P8P3_9ROSI
MKISHLLGNDVSTFTPNAATEVINPITPHAVANPIDEVIPTTTMNGLSSINCGASLEDNNPSIIHEGDYSLLEDDAHDDQQTVEEVATIF